MKPKALLVQHMRRDPEDRVSNWLLDAGFELDWRWPAEGDSLPESTVDHELAVVYGGVQSANDDSGFMGREIEWASQWARAGRPYLGICLGAQILARSLGAQVARHPAGLHEIGFVRIEPDADGEEAVAGGDAAEGEFLDAPLHVFHWHNEGFEIPDGGVRLARGDVFPNQAFRWGPRAYALQFHPEATPVMLRRWNEQVEHGKGAPGAHPPERQFADAERFDAPMGEWFRGFLDRWLGR